MRNMINLEAQETGVAIKEKKYVDELCNIIRKGCTLNDFKNAC
jgi:hypothetical protein